MKKSFIIASAGHVDHGKTTLIKMLTGVDCDTHPEEKKRGITIHLGFSHINFDEDTDAGIIDVPGHKDFIHNMISGVNGIDAVIFVIAANEGFMPQSNEHLEILNFLKINKGLIALTKCDLVDEETLFIAEEEIKERIHNTCLENFPIIKTSTTDMDSTVRLRDCLKHCFSVKSLSENKSYFRMYPDRFFQVKGYGSVVTGSVLSGNLSKGQTIYSSFRDEQLRIKRIEQYGREVDSICKGQRASLNIANLEKEHFAKGIMFSEHPVQKTALIDVSLSLFSRSLSLDLWSTVELYSGTIQTQAKIHLIDVSRISKGETCLAQIHLDKISPLCYGDKFIIRNSSNEITLGGGQVIDTYPLHHRRRSKKTVDLLKLRNSGRNIDLLSTEIEKTIKPVTLENICSKLFIKTDEFKKNLDLSLLSEKYIVDNNTFWLKTEYEKLKVRVKKFLGIAHKQNPLDKNGKTFEELKSVYSENSLTNSNKVYYNISEKAKEIFLKKALEDLTEEAFIEKRENTYALTTHTVELQTEDHMQINWVDQFILNQRMKTPLWSEITERSKRRNISEKKLKQILNYLVSKGRLISFEGEFLHNYNVQPVRLKLLEYLKSNPQGIKVSEFRDLINANRKICLLMLNIFDDEGITNRIDDVRTITEKGNLLFEEFKI